MPLGQENLSPGDEDRDPQSPATVRHNRSMLDVDDPPKLSPWKPMSFDELYSGPIQVATNSEPVDDTKCSTATAGSPRSATARQQRLSDSTSQEPPQASANTPK